MTTAVRPFTSLAACLLSLWCKGNGSSLDGRLLDLLACFAGAIELVSKSRVGALRDDGCVYEAILVPSATRLKMSLTFLRPRDQKKRRLWGRECYEAKKKPN